ncbi:hypothetical protein, partial [Faecalispora jeddahensis]|uniref:hypothetical protein n=1 Tax=Faecalispora jeddahensis TaxID=1414721 RepID=UPI0019D539CC
RYLILSLIQNKSAKETKQTLCSSLKDKPVLSITLDNSCEFAGFKDKKGRACPGLRGKPAPAESTRGTHKDKNNDYNGKPSTCKNNQRTRDKRSTKQKFF